MQHEWDKNVCRFCGVNQAWPKAAGPCPNARAKPPANQRVNRERLAIRRRALGPTVLRTLNALLERELGRPPTPEISYADLLQTQEWVQFELSRTSTLEAPSAAPLSGYSAAAPRARSKP